MPSAAPIRIVVGSLGQQVRTAALRDFGGMNGSTEHSGVFETSRALLEIPLDLQRGCSALSGGRRAGRGCPPVSASLECPLWGSGGAACQIQC